MSCSSAVPLSTTDFIMSVITYAVAGEIASVALIVWAPIAGVLATTGFGVLMVKRIRVEDRALGRIQ